MSVRVICEGRVDRIENLVIMQYAFSIQIFTLLKFTRCDKVILPVRVICEGRVNRNEHLVSTHPNRKLHKFSFS